MPGPVAGYRERMVMVVSQSEATMVSVLVALRQRQTLLEELLQVLQQLCEPQPISDIVVLESLVERQQALASQLAALDADLTVPAMHGVIAAEVAEAIEQGGLLVQRLATVNAQAGAMLAGRLLLLKAEAAYLDRLLAPAQTYQEDGTSRYAGHALALRNGGQA